MSRTEKLEPEQEVFLPQALAATEAYRLQHGRYAQNWHEVDFTYADNGYYITDPDVRAKPSDGPRWRPRDCKFIYVIAKATETAVLIQALNDRGDVEYEIEQRMTEPRKVSR